MFTFKPAIWRNSTLYELPRPVTLLRLQDSWDITRFKVPLAAGDIVAGTSRNGLDVAIEGQLAAQAGQPVAGEEQMFLELETLRTQLDVTDPDTFELFLYHDSPSGTYRSLRGCTTLRFDYDLSSPRLFTYSIAIHAADPTIYTAAPA